MKNTGLNTGIIYTNSKCIGCNKCISGCVAIGANVVVKSKKSDTYKIVVDPTKCILCGHCVEECLHKARTYRDDTDAFFEALKNGENISILIAPSLRIDYEKEYNNILGYLKHLGVNHIYNTSFGADIMVWVYMNFIHEFGLYGVISQFCPVIVNYLEKYKPELLNYLMPVQSPLICTAIYVSDYLKNNDKLAYISPCIAEKYEIQDVNTYGKVHYNVTFSRLMEKLSKEDISGFYGEGEVSYGLGSLTSSAGGLSNNIKPYIGFNKVLIQTSGYSNIFPYFDHYSEEFNNNGELPFLVDVLSCVNGCDFGTGSNFGVEFRNKVTFAAHRAREKAYKSGNAPNGKTLELRLASLNERFKDFELSSYVRQYDYTREIKPTVIPNNKINEIFQSMYKDTKGKQTTDCGSCGYFRCLDMAYSIGLNNNYKENCIHYSKERVRLETEKTMNLMAEISEMNEELKKSGQLKSNFLANMSHEIRTPMNAVIGMAELALRGTLSNEERGYINQIQSSGRSLLAIINDILDFSKIESGKMEINEVDYEVMSLIKDTVNVITTRIGEKDIALKVDVDPNIPLILHGDDIRIKQVIVNLANNAIKFTESGFVELSLSYEHTDYGVSLTYSVKDTGIGIKKDDVKKLFNSFQQVDSKRNRNIEGTGLGLAICRELVVLMGGEVFVESEYGKGSIFSFVIPQKIVDNSPSVKVSNSNMLRTVTLIEDQNIHDTFINNITKLDVNNIDCTSLDELLLLKEENLDFFFIDYSLWNKVTKEFAKTLNNVQIVIILDPTKNIIDDTNIKKLNLPIYSYNLGLILNNKTDEATNSKTNHTNFTFVAPDADILIVDDNEINLTVAQGLLSPLKMKITLASSGKEAITLVELNKFDIVFMDHMMPEIDGVEATHIIRSKEGSYFKELPIIALTANAINDARDMFLREGMVDFVAKPIEMRDITAKIRRWLPEHKIKDIDYENDKNEILFPDETLEIEGLDVNAGLMLSGSMDLYKKILNDYYAVIEKKADLIERYQREGNLERYTIEVHALKSASKLIGAEELSQLAANLEESGHQGDKNSIDKGTELLLSIYRSYIEILSPYCAPLSPPSTLTSLDISSEEKINKLNELFNALEDFDLDTAQEIINFLENVTFKLDEKELITLIKENTDAMEYDIASEYVQQLLNLDI